MGLKTQTEWVRTLVRGPKLSRPLSYEQAYAVAEAILHEAVDSRILAALLATWRVRGETATEIAAFSTVFSDCIVSKRPEAAATVWACYPVEGSKYDVSVCPVADSTHSTVAASQPTYPTRGTVPFHIDLDLSNLLPQVMQVVDSYEIFGLRTMLHTALKTLAGPAGAVKGVTHPPYGETSIAAWQQRGLACGAVLQSRGGLPVFQAGRRHRIWYLHGGTWQDWMMWDGTDEGQGLGSDDAAVAATALLYRAVQEQWPAQELQQTLQAMQRA